MSPEYASRRNTFFGRPCGPDVAVAPHLSRCQPRWRAAYLAVTAVAALGLLCFPVLADQSLSPQAKRGFAIVQAYCARCHAVERIGDSPLPAAPPFRVLHERYPIESLEESLAEGIVTGHPDMPEFSFDSGQVGDVIAYLKSLER
jgi:cytochrome c